MPRKWTEEEKQRARETYKQRQELARQRARDARVPPQTGVQVECSVRVSVEELVKQMPPVNVEAFMHGVAQVLNASKRNEDIPSPHQHVGEQTKGE